MQQLCSSSFGDLGRLFRQRQRHGLVLFASRHGWIRPLGRRHEWEVATAPNVEIQAIVGRQWTAPEIVCRRFLRSAPAGAVDSEPDQIHRELSLPIVD